MDQSKNVNEVMDLFTIHVDTHTVGTVRSHPTGGLEPSEADSRAFMQSGGDYHIIVCYPYNISSWACYDRFGNRRELAVLDVEPEESPITRDIEEAFGDDIN